MEDRRVVSTISKGYRGHFEMRSILAEKRGKDTRGRKGKRCVREQEISR